MHTRDLWTFLFDQVNEKRAAQFYAKCLSSLKSGKWLNANLRAFDSVCFTYFISSRLKVCLLRSSRKLSVTSTNIIGE